MSSNDFKISVVIPVYNTEDYLADAIDSIVSQTIGFDRIQLILVDDGSTDSSNAICRQYCVRYPGNVKLIEKENGGVASACNAALPHIRGEYVNFFGSDDLWESDALEKAVDYLDENYERIDLVSCRINFFGAKEGYLHPLDYRFKCDQVIDLSRRYWCIQMMSGNCVIKASSLRGRSFDEKLHCSEDAFLICSILLEKWSYGVLRSAVYHYRKRGNSSSLTEVAVLNKTRYLESPPELILKLIDYSKRQKGFVPRFIQYTVAYESQWVVREPLPENLTEEEKALYKAYLLQMLADVDDEVICKLRNLSWHHKIMLLRLKHGDSFRDALSCSHTLLLCNETPILSFQRDHWPIYVKLLSIKDHVLTLEGVSDVAAILPECKMMIKLSNGQTIYPENGICAPYVVPSFMGSVDGTGRHFQCSINLDGVESVEFFIEGLPCGLIPISPEFSIFAKLARQYKNSYYISGEYLLRRTKNGISIESSFGKGRECETAFLRELSTTEVGKRQAGYRLLASLLKPFYKKPIWIISDRFNKAGDNAENLFKYLSEINAAKEYNIYFLFEREYPDYRRLKKYGKILDPRSKKYKVLFLLASKIISSHADATVMNPFKRHGYAYSDMFEFDYVYIQHGVMPGDLSKWLNKMNKNARLITTSAYREYEALLGPEYGYSETELALTGMPRHDALAGESPEKKIVFLPTWREKLAGKIIHSERRREKVANFSETYYCKFYNGLINDERLINAMKEMGYTGEFYVHPSFEEQASDFVGNDTIVVGSGLANYESILNRASLMVTDYSSVAFDFGWQGKPVVYSQFDSNEYWGLHFYDKGYFDYESDGFGPVCYTHDECVDTLIEAMKNDCKFSQEYQERGSRFFAFQDHNNAKRVYEAIRSLDKKES